MNKIKKKNRNQLINNKVSSINKISIKLNNNF